MNSQNNADDSMNFSVIDKNEQRQANIDFSVQSLLENNESGQKIKQQPLPFHPATHRIFSKINNLQSSTSRSFIQPDPCSKQEGSQHFLKDLSRMEKELSFEAESYDIYGDNSSTTEMVLNNKSKTLSVLKVTKQYTNKSISKESLQDFNDYYGDLIIEFRTKDTKAKAKINSNPDSKNASNNFSGQQSKSNFANIKNRKDSKSNHQLKTFYRINEQASSSKSKLLLEHRKSKSKSMTHKIKESNSKSHIHLKTSIQAETFQQKVFTQYYGTETYLKPKKNDLKKKKEIPSQVTSKSKSKSKMVRLLSPREKRLNIVSSKKFNQYL